MKRCEVSRLATGRPQFITNGRKKRLKVHKVAVDGMEFPPYMWRARCGFRFAFCGFTRHTSLDIFCRKAWCSKCLGEEIVEDADEQTRGAGIDSESSDGSSTLSGLSQYSVGPGAADKESD